MEAPKPKAISPESVKTWEGFADYIHSLATVDVEKAVNLIDSTKPNSLHKNIVHRLYIMGRLPTGYRNGISGKFWEKIEHLADMLELTNKSSKEEAMVALRQLTTYLDHIEPPEALAAFERKFNEAPRRMWDEFVKSFTGLLEQDMRLSLNLIINLLNDRIFLRVVEESKDPEHEPTSLLQDDIFAACGGAVITYKIQGYAEALKPQQYREQNLEVGADGWIQRIAGTKVITKSKAVKEAEADLYGGYTELIWKCKSEWETFPKD